MADAPAHVTGVGVTPAGQPQRALAARGPDAARRENEALHFDWRLRFHDVDNDQLICYSKTTADRSNAMLMVVNLDPHWPQAGWLDVPLLCVLAKSPFWSDDYEAFVRKLAPRVEYRVLDGVGHFLMMEKPKEFNDAVIAFLDKNALLKKK